MPCSDANYAPGGRFRTVVAVAAGDSKTEGYVNVPGWRRRVWDGLAADGITLDYRGSNIDASTWLYRYHEGYSGYTVAQLRTKLITEGKLVMWSPDLMLYAAGINNLLNGGLNNGDPQTVIDGIDDTLNDAYALLPNLMVVVENLPPSALDENHPTSPNPALAPLIATANTGIAEVVARHCALGRRVVLDDVFSVINLSDFDMRDEAHYNDPQGYVKVAMSKRAAINRVLGHTGAVAARAY